MHFFTITNKVFKDDMENKDVEHLKIKKLNRNQPTIILLIHTEMFKMLIPIIIHWAST